MPRKISPLFGGWTRPWKKKVKPTSEVKPYPNTRRIDSTDTTQPRKTIVKEKTNPTPEKSAKPQAPLPDGTGKELDISSKGIPVPSQKKLNKKV